MECQLCEGTITPVKRGEAEIYLCEKCNGFWVKSGELNKLIKHKVGDVEASSIDHHFHKDDHGTLKCAFCVDKATNKVNFIDFSDIILDYCEECGAFWIDNGELDKMQAYMDKIEKNSDKQTIAEKIMNIIYSLPKV